MSNFGLFILLFVTPVVLIISAYLVAKYRQKIPRTSSFISGLLLSGLGVFILLDTYELFSINQAIPPLRMAAPFTKEEHPMLFVSFTILNPVIGLVLLGGGLRAIFMSISNKHTGVKNDVHP